MKTKLIRKAAEVAFRRERILKVASQLIEVRNVDDVSMDDIASAADYTRRTIYNYFKSFDELYLTLLVESHTSRWDLQKKAVTQADTGMAKLRAWALALREFRRANPHYGRLEAYWDYHGVREERLSPDLFACFRAINDELADGLRGIFRLGMSDATLRPDLDVDLCVSLFLHSFRAILQRAESSAYSFARFDPDTYVDQFLDLFSRAIRIKGDSL
jgi:AcrR family transcriptional regulator